MPSTAPPGARAGPQPRSPSRGTTTRARGPVRGLPPPAGGPGRRVGRGGSRAPGRGYCGHVSGTPTSSSCRSSRPRIRRPRARCSSTGCVGSRRRAATARARPRGRALPVGVGAHGRDVTPRRARPVRRPCRSSPGELEEHIIADVAWAAVRYSDWTGDGPSPGPGRDLLVETARYWASRIRLDRRRPRPHLRRHRPGRVPRGRRRQRVHERDGALEPAPRRRRSPGVAESERARGSSSPTRSSTATTRATGSTSSSRASRAGAVLHRRGDRAAPALPGRGAANAVRRSGWRARSRTPGSSARSPCTRPSASRSTGPCRSGTRSPRCSTSPTSCSPSAAREAGRRAHRDDGARRLPRQVRLRPLHRQPAHRRLACQIGIEPKVILFDEPTSGIAQRETEALGRCSCRIRDIIGASILLIEHDMPLVSAVSDRIIAFDLGRVVVEGDWELVREHPQVVASYLGSTREVIERSGPSSETTPRARGGPPMTQTDRRPEFKAADNRSTWTSVGSGACCRSTRTRSASRGRRCSGRCCAARSAR